VSTLSNGRNTGRSLQAVSPQVGAFPISRGESRHLIAVEKARQESEREKNYGTAMGRVGSNSPFRPPRPFRKAVS
jgi:hypothetical protein